MSDLINRQDAIDAIESHIRTAEEPYQLTQTDEVLNHAFEISASCIYNLPSAQPEIIRCKDCKWWSEKPLTITRRCSIFDTDTDMTFFCKHGRRENE